MASAEVATAMAKTATTINLIINLLPVFGVNSASALSLFLSRNTLTQINRVADQEGIMGVIDIGK